MKSTTITGYTADELRKQFPKEFKRAHERYCNDLRDIPWQNETIDSLKRLLEAAGIRLKDWSLGAYNRGNHISIEFPCASDYNSDDVPKLSGPRAMAWLENNLLGPLRVKPNMRIDDWRPQLDPATGFVRKGQRLRTDNTACYYHTGDKLHRRDGRMGEIPSCPFTGYCADEDYLQAVRKSIRDGDTLKESFENLADVCMNLLEEEDAAQREEDYFADHTTANGYLWDDEGAEVTDHFRKAA